MNNKNDCITLIIIILLFAICGFNLSKKGALNSYKILKITQENNFYIDFNKNSIAEDDELACFKDIKVFYPLKNLKSTKQAQDLNLNINDFLKNGYIAQEFLKENYLDKEIFLKERVYDKNLNINFVKIKNQNEDIAQELLKNGLAFLDENSKNSQYYQYFNLKQTKLNSKEINELDFYIKNNKNSILHKLNCKFAKLIAQGEITLDKNSAIPCGYCLKNLKETNLFKSKREYKTSFSKNFGEIELFFLNPYELKKPDKTRQNVFTKTLIKEIDSSQNSIDIALYGFGEQDDIKKALYRAKERGVKIRLVLDDSKNTKNLYPNNDTLYKDFNSSKDSIESLMHNKFFIFDDKKVLTGSSNISSTDSGGYSANIMALISSKELAEQFKQEFEQMFKGQFSIKKQKLEKQPIYLKNTILEAYFTPKDDILNSKLLPLIKNSKKEILISAFYLTHKSLINELISAKERGVRVVIIIDALGAGNFKERINLLRKAKIPTKAENWGGKNHEKTMVIDEKYLILGSSNFSKNAFNKNDENMLIIKNPEIAQYYRDYFIYLFNSIDDKYLYFYPKPESLESKNSCFDGIDNDFDGKIDMEDNGCRM